MSVNDLMEDRVTLDGVLMKCNQNPSGARSDVECMNARVAIERLASQSEPAEEAKRQASSSAAVNGFDWLRTSSARKQEEKAKVDAYHLPLVPVDPPATPRPNP